MLFATYEGRASGAQTKPSGTHLKDKHIVYWRLGDLTPSSATDWQKIVCRIVGEQGAEPKPGIVEARWEFTPPPPLPDWLGGNDHENEIETGAISVSRLEEASANNKGKDREVEDDDPFADAASESGATTTTDAPPSPKWVEVPVVRRLVSGKYQALPL